MGLIFPCVYLFRESVKGEEPPETRYTYSSTTIPQILWNHESAKRLPTKMNDIAVCVILLTTESRGDTKITDLLKTEELDVHVFTAEPEKMIELLQVDGRENPRLFVHSVHQVKVKHEGNGLTVVLETSGDMVNSLFTNMLTKLDGKDDVSLYSYINVLKLCMLHILLGMEYEFVGYQDIGKFKSMGQFIINEKVKNLVRHFGIVAGAGFDPEVTLMILHKSARDAMQRTLFHLLNFKHTTSESYRFASVKALALVRILWHMESMPLESSKEWYHEVVEGKRKKTCTRQFVNNQDDITFAMMVLSLRCNPKWMLNELYHDFESNAFHIIALYSYVHQVLLRQLHLWNVGILKTGDKIFRVTDDIVFHPLHKLESPTKEDCRTP
jgi:hypothetical protein